VDSKTLFSKEQHMRTFLIVAAAVSFISLNAFAQEKTDAKKPTQQEMMEAMMKYGTPGPEHEKLKSMAGTFDADVTFKMASDAPEEKSTGKMVNTMLMDGRYLKGDYSGSWSGMPFTGMSLTAYDKMKEKYVNLWIDSMSTMLMTSEGTGSGNAITMSCTFDCPITKEKKTTRQVITMADNDHHTVDMYCTEAGKEYKMMTIKYTRSKDATAGK
jgi:hypothetical protein